MGKYMKKSRTSGDVASSSLGVQTRANRLRPPPSPPQIHDSSEYLQLRSRRLLKLQPPPPRKESSVEVENLRLKENSEKTASPSSVSESGKLEAEEESVDLSIEGSCGENFLEGEAIDRSTRESTPCSLIMDSNSITIPGSSTRQSTHQINHENVQRIFPTSHEMDEFFVHAERQQQAMFMQKYNFDIVNDVPLKGQYKWVQVLN
ncbi:PREDICTED: cyclin-dependent kinase inhibitor 3-like isoform X2 [Lupinus angustifolius]|nr:PREDICTED: cyclin-dependent kinase inhibitor 3-like isoform X2 [Lupinus angustifolius]